MCLLSGGQILHGILVCDVAQVKSSKALEMSQSLLGQLRQDFLLHVAGPGWPKQHGEEALQGAGAVLNLPRGYAGEGVTKAPVEAGVQQHPAHTPTQHGPDAVGNAEQTAAPVLCIILRTSKQCYT